MGLIRIKNQRWFGLVKFLLGVFSSEFTEYNQTGGEFGGATTFFTQAQAKEIATRVDYNQGYEKVHRAMWNAGLNTWQVIADQLNKNGHGQLELTEVEGIGKTTAAEIVLFGLKKGLLWIWFEE